MSSPATPLTPEGCRLGLETLLVAAQKARSNLREACPDPEVLAQTNPLLFGERTVLDLLLDASLKPTEDPFALQLEYLNFLSVALELEPSIGMAALNVGGAPLPSMDEAREAVYAQRRFPSTII